MVFKSSRLPYSIEVATNVPAAKRYLEQHADSNRPDLVFLDAFEMLQELPTAANVPLFMLTNSASPAERENFRKDFGDPAQRCIEKPFTRQKLSDCLVAADLDTWATRLSAR
jgi:CheY-like chemotaxis protein